MCEQEIDEIQPRIFSGCSTKYVAVEVIDDGVSTYAESGIEYVSDDWISEAKPHQSS